MRNVYTDLVAQYTTIGLAIGLDWETARWAAKEIVAEKASK